MFAPSRDPNDHDDKPDSGSKERNRFRSVTWDEYDPVHQKYLEISKYRYVLSRLNYDFPLRLKHNIFIRSLYQNCTRRKLVYLFSLSFCLLINFTL